MITVTSGKSNAGEGEIVGVGEIDGVGVIVLVALWVDVRVGEGDTSTEGVTVGGRVGIALAV
jgi:hypothetical protein